MTTAPEPAPSPIADGRLLTGHVAEWGQLLDVIAERHGLTVVVADPKSGTSALLSHALKQSDAAYAQVDARNCSDALDLAMSIGDAAVRALVPEAAAWWAGQASPSSTAGLRVHRALSEQGVDIDGIRFGEGRKTEGLGNALDLTAALAGSPVTLVIDHLGLMLANLRADPAREILSIVRTARQRHPELDLLLVDHPGGPITSALGDEHHPLFRAGERLRITRPSPDRFTGDLVITRPLLEEPVELLRAAADLAAGSPPIIWQIIDLAPPHGDSTARAVAGWQRLRSATETATSQQWDLLRRVHPAAMSLVAALSLGIPPHSIPVASKSVADGLNRLRDIGLAWQPEPRHWTVADPLLAAYARQHAPPWATRRSAYARASQST